MFIFFLSFLISITLVHKIYFEPYQIKFIITNSQDLTEYSINIPSVLIWYLVFLFLFVSSYIIEAIAEGQREYEREEQHNQELVKAYLEGRIDEDDWELIDYIKSLSR